MRNANTLFQADWSIGHPHQFVFVTLNIKSSSQNNSVNDNKIIKGCPTRTYWPKGATESQRIDVQNVPINILFYEYMSLQLKDYKQQHHIGHIFYVYNGFNI